MRILMTNWLYAPEFSGAALQCHRLSLQLDKLGAKVEILAGTDDAHLVGRSEVDGVPVIRVLRNKSSLHQHLHFAWNLFHYIVSNRAQYDLLHSHGFLAPVSLAAKVTRLPLVQKITNLQVDDPIAVRGRALGDLQFRLYRHACTVIATSKLLENTCRECLLEDDQVLRIPNGVDKDVFSPASPAEKSVLRQKYHIPADKTVLLTVGTVSSTKGLDMLIRAFYTLRQNLQTEPLLLVVGPHSYARGFCNNDPGTERFSRWVSNLVEEYDLHQLVRFEGTQPHVHEYMKAADIYIHPSRREGQPNALLEAMSCGLPTVANLIPGITDEVLQSGKFGYLVDGEKTGMFAAALKVLIKNPSLRARLGQNARSEILEKYDIAYVAKQYMELYRQLIYNSEVKMKGPKAYTTRHDNLTVERRRIEQKRDR